MRVRASQELPLILPLGPAVPVIGVPTAAASVFPAVSPGVYAAGPLSDGEYVASYLALVDSQFARSILRALPLL